MQTIFLESHHLKNLYFGFGQFNYHLLKSLARLEDPEFCFVLHANNAGFFRKEFGGNFKYKRYFSLRRYPSLRIRKKYDLWHSLNQNTRVEPYHDIPYLLTVHDHPRIKDPATYREQPDHITFQEKLDRSVAITYISEYSKTSTHQNYNVPNVPEYVIYNGNPAAGVTVPAGFIPKFVPKRPFLFTIGVIDPRKNFASLVQMMQELPELDLVIAGKNTTSTGEQVAQLIKEMGLEQRVTLAGKITDMEKHWYYQNCRAFVFPSTREGFGLPVIEAMGFGKPVFLSDKTCLPEIGGDAARYWNDFDAGYMANTVQNGLYDYDNDLAMAAKLITRAEDFSWDKAARQYYEVYREILKK